MFKSRPYLILLTGAAGLLLTGCGPRTVSESTTIVRSEGLAGPEAGQTATVIFAGLPHPVVGNPVRAGDMAPDVALVANDLMAVRLASYRGNVVVLSVVPSLDTGVCSAQTRRFNELAGQMGPNVRVLTISMDLPFAQKRWCGAEGIEGVQTLSDHRTGAFGLAYGVLMPDVRLLARSVFLVDRTGRLRYVHRLADLSKEPDYDEVLEQVRKLQAERR